MGAEELSTILPDFPYLSHISKDDDLLNRILTWIGGCSKVIAVTPYICAIVHSVSNLIRIPTWNKQDIDDIRGGKGLILR